jgi:hypothetical protein
MGASCPGQSGQSFELLAEIAAKDDGVDFDAGDEVASIQFLARLDLCPCTALNAQHAAGATQARPR